MSSNEVTFNPIQANRIPNAVLGILFLLSAEIMYFAGLISAYIIGRAGELEWPPYGQPRLPIEVTAVNTLVLLASGFVGWLFIKSLPGTKKGQTQNLTFLLLSIVLGFVFLVVQGGEWVRLVGYGLTSRSSLYGAFFYVIIGSHGIHALAGLVALLYLYYYWRKHGIENPAQAMVKTRACMLYWYFVVGIWPVLYYLVYLI